MILPQSHGRYLLLLALCAFLFSTPAIAGGDSWLTSWESAAKESKKSGKPILMDFTGSDWCPNCKLLHREVFDTPEFKTWAAKKVVLLKLDFPRKAEIDAKTKAQNEKLKEKYAVKEWPTIIFTDHNGKTLATSKYEKGGSANWIKQADAKLKVK